jgi:acetoin utilization deacetylase AcuC-like enzyme
MAGSVRRAANAAGVPLGCVLEGGYALGALARSVAATMGALSGTLKDASAPVPLTPVASEVRERLASDAYGWFA